MSKVLTSHSKFFKIALNLIIFQIPTLQLSTILIFFLPLCPMCAVPYCILFLLHKICIFQSSLGDVLYSGFKFVNLKF